MLDVLRRVAALTAVAGCLICGGCGASSAHPGQFTVCLASHGIKLPNSRALTACIQGADDLSALQACLTKGAR